MALPMQRKQKRPLVKRLASRSMPIAGPCPDSRGPMMQAAKTDLGLRADGLDLVLGEED